MGSMGVPHPMRTGPPQLLCQGGILVLDHASDRVEEPADDAPESSGGDRLIAIVGEPPDDRGSRDPLGMRDG